MPATLKIDRLDGARFENDLINGRRLVRVGYISDIPIGSLRPDPNILIKALSTQGMPQLSDPHPAGLGLYVVRHIFYPYSDTQCRVEIVYESSPITPTGQVYIITDNTSLTQDTTQLVPGTWQQLNVSYKPPRGGATITDIATMSYPLALRQRTLEKTVLAGGPGVGTGGLPNTYGDTVGCVNLNPWQGKPKGFWLMTAFDSQTSDWGRSFLVRAVFTTKIRFDWSQYAVVRDSHTGKYITIDPSVVRQLSNQPYAVGVTSGNGIIKTGLHPTADFTQIFGI